MVLTQKNAKHSQRPMRDRGAPAAGLSHLDTRARRRRRAKSFDRVVALGPIPPDALLDVPRPGRAKVAPSRSDVAEPIAKVPMLTLHFATVSVSKRRALHRLRAALCVGAASCLLLACEPELRVGSWSCPYPSRVPDGGESEALTPYTGPVRVPWSTSFEWDMCDYNRELGFCYVHGNAKYDFVDMPVHSGKRAMSFSLTAGPNTDARCVREGTFPEHAMFTAWFNIPAETTNTGNWNLIHFEGGNGDGTSLHRLWDVSICNAERCSPQVEDAPAGSLHLYWYDQLSRGARVGPGPIALPIGKWFRLDVRWLRSNGTEEIEILQDGQRAVFVTNLPADDSKWRQWYVGNLATGLTPSSNTIFVDDVAISSLP